MNIAEYRRLLDAAKRSHQPVVCPYCGEETLSGGGTTFCSNCECLLAQAEGAAIPKSHEALDQIRSASAKGDYDTILYTYTELEKVSPIPQLWYCHGLAYVEYSNSFVVSIRYDRPGFMEENARLRDNSFKMLAEAKRMFAKAAYHSEKAISDGNMAVELRHTMFLCLLRIGEPRRARQVMDGYVIGTPAALTGYSDLLLYLSSMEYRQASAIAEKLARAEDAPINAFYYLAFLAFKSGRPKDALLMIDALEGVIDPVKLQRLAAEIRDQMAV